MKRNFSSAFEMQRQNEASPDRSAEDASNAASQRPSAVKEIDDENEVKDETASHWLAPPPTLDSLLVTQSFCPSGFDMLGVLMRVATRPSPKINIGAVDMGCALIVCDITQDDLPIVYCSEAFEYLTGYTQAEILGRNCRFLQSPDGQVQAGQPRKHVDARSVLNLKDKISNRNEVQVSLTNYRKGGQGFLNLLSMVPIAWDTPDFKYYVGFQVEAKRINPA